MAGTGQRAGVEQIGGFYGNTPYDRDEFWLSYDPAKISMERVVEVMEKANATHVAVSNPALAPRFAADLRFETIFSEGRYTLYARRGTQSRWAWGDDGSTV